MKNFHILKWALIIGIMIVLNLFFNYTISSVYKEPKFDNFCKQGQVMAEPKTKEACVAIGGSWNESSSFTEKSGQPEPVPATREFKSVSTCNVYFTCQKQYEAARDIYNRNVFIVLVILGLISLIVSFFVMNITAVALGLSLGGVLSFVIASMRYWSAMGDYLRVVILALALTALIWLGVKKIRD